MTELNARKALEKDIASFELKVLGKKSDDSDD